VNLDRIRNLGRGTRRPLVAIILGAAIATAASAQSPQFLEKDREFRALYQAGQYEAALSAGRALLEISEREYGPEGAVTAVSLNNVGVVLRALGRHSQAERALTRALGIQQKIADPDSESLASTLNTLGSVYDYQGRYEAAETLYRRALTLREDRFGGRHPLVADSLESLAILYENQGKQIEALPLHERALEIRQRHFGPRHPSVAGSLHNLANLHAAAGRRAKAIELFSRTVEILEAAYGKSHPKLAASQTNLANLLALDGRYDAAERLLQAALASQRSRLGEAHLQTAATIDALAYLRSFQGEFGQAVALLRRGLEIRIAGLGPTHPEVAAAHNNLAVALARAGNDRKALSHTREATTIQRRRLAQSGDLDLATAVREQKQASYIFRRNVAFLVRNLSGIDRRDRALMSEAFRTAQVAQASSTAQAISNMAARFAVGQGALAALVHERQDLILRLQVLERRLYQSWSGTARSNGLESADLLRSVEAVSQRVAALEAEIDRNFPGFKQLTRPEPVTIDAVQALLAPEEAMLVYLIDEAAGYVWVVRRDLAEFLSLDVRSDALKDEISLLRSYVDPTAVGSVDDLDFDVEAAFELYRRIFQPVEAALADARQIFIVPDGSLGALPFGMLLAGDAPLVGKNFGDLAWLAKKYAFSILPSVDTLRALRRKKRTLAGSPFVGFGDPVLDGRAGGARSVEAEALFGSGFVADVAKVRRLPRLPETADEILSIARLFGADERSVFLGRQATERAVRSMDLSDVRVLAFATHGLVAGEFAGAPEPGLVFTPPPHGDSEDDGILTASEVAQLKLDADLVILSACNTAASDGGPGSEGLSGLAKAFFYAGSRTLYVSHWPVFSDATMRLTSQMFVGMKAAPGIGWSEALRRAMLDLMADRDKPHFAHPVFWAPFTIVGESRLLRPLFP